MGLHNSSGFRTKVRNGLNFRKFEAHRKCPTSYLPIWNGTREIKVKSKRQEAMICWSSVEWVRSFVWGYGSHNLKADMSRVVKDQSRVAVVSMEENKQRKWKRKGSSSSSPCINNLDDGCLMHIFSFLSPIPGTSLSLSLCSRASYVSICCLNVYSFNF